MIKIAVGNESLTKPYRNTIESLHEIKVTETVLHLRISVRYFKNVLNAKSI